MISKMLLLPVAIKLIDRLNTLTHTQTHTHTNSLIFRTDKKTNPDYPKLSNERIEKEEENVKTQLSKLIQETLTSSILSIQYVQYYVSSQELQVQIELINTNSYLDGNFLLIQNS